METIQAYFDGNVFVPITPVKAKLNQLALIIIQETANKKAGDNQLNNLFGTLSFENYSEILEVLKDTEKVDVNDW
jgi:hypothetical protein